MCLFENVFAVFVHVYENMSFGIIKKTREDITMRCHAAEVTGRVDGPLMCV